MFRKSIDSNQIRESFQSLSQQIWRLESRLEQMRLSLGRLESRATRGEIDLQRTEFQVFSQDGEDGIIQSLVSRIPIASKVFVEFGVENYTQCNTRFLVENDYWSGLVIDGSKEQIEQLKRESIFWRRSLKAVSAFITRENINDLISGQGIDGEIGLLSVDIDGNDYWVLEAINCVRPSILVCEYNSLFGPYAKISVPYDPEFVRTKAHFSNLYFGASLGAMTHLANKKGYELVTSNLFGTNAFFVRRDLLGNLVSKTADEAWVPAKFRESRNEKGHLTYLSPEQGRALLADMPVVDVITGRKQSLRESFG